MGTHWIEGSQAGQAASTSGAEALADLLGLGHQLNALTQTAKTLGFTLVPAAKANVDPPVAGQ